MANGHSATVPAPAQLIKTSTAAHLRRMGPPSRSDIVIGQVCGARPALTTSTRIRTSLRRTRSITMFPRGRRSSSRWMWANLPSTPAACKEEIAILPRANASIFRRISSRSNRNCSSGASLSPRVTQRSAKANRPLRKLPSTRYETKRRPVEPISRARVARTSDSKKIVSAITAAASVTSTQSPPTFPNRRRRAAPRLWIASARRGSAPASVLAAMVADRPTPSR